MTTLAKNTPRPYELGDMNNLPVVASDIIYEGAAVGIDSNGYARPLVAGDKFAGFSTEHVDNSSGNNGDKTVRVRRRGAVELPIAALAITDNGAAVYASDDDTFTLVSTANSRIGTVVRWEETGVGLVDFEEYKGV